LGMRLLRIRHGVLILAALGASLGFYLPTSCQAADARKVKVLTSVVPVYCFTVNVAGNLASVENLLPGRIGPHDYQFTSADVRKLNQADLIVVNGLGLESWLDKAIEANRRKSSVVKVEAAAGLNSRLVSGQNPHVWLDPTLAAHCVTNISIALQKADPANAKGYAENAARYIQKLEQLDMGLGQTLQPLKMIPFITYHDAFPYLVRRYGLNQVGVVEKVPDVEPSAKDLRALSQLVREKKVKVIFTEPQFSSKLVQQLSRDLGVTAAPLDPIETGELSPTVYEDAMRTNARVLVEHLK
jgi:zinc transport system substrate-binding protein